MNLIAEHLKCFEAFRGFLNIPLIIATSNRCGSAGSSRNTALAVVSETESVLLHDDDEYVPPQTLELLQWLFTKHQHIDIIVAAYLYEWKSSGNPWCMGNFDRVVTTDNVVSEKQRRGLRVVGNPLCSAVAHGYPAFRRNPINQFRIQYDEAPASGEDGRFLSDAVARNANVLHACFPLLAYRSNLPTSTNLSQNKCACFDGFSRCEYKNPIGRIGCTNHSSAGKGCHKAA